MIHDGDVRVFSASAGSIAGVALAHLYYSCERHALVAYVFGTVIVGLTINLMAGFLR